MDCFKSVSGKNLPQGFAWMNEPREWVFKQEQLQIQAPAGADFFLDPRGEKPREPAPFLYMEHSGDFTVTTRVDVDMKSEFDSGCLMVWHSREFWAKICYEMSYGWPSIVSVVTKRHSDDSNTLMTLAEPPYLRLTRVGSSLAMHYSLDDKMWYLVRYCSLLMHDTVRIGVAAQSPGGEGCSVWFSGFSVIPEGIGPIRSGI